MGYPDSAGNRPGVFRTATQARRALDRYITDMEYIAHRRGSTAAPLAANTVVGYKASLNNVICHSAANLGAAPVSALRARGIESWINDLSRAAVKRPTIRAAQRLLSASLTWEMRQGHLATNPASLVRHEHSKFSRGADQGDVVLLPTWKELATMVGQPQFEEDRPKAGINGHVPLPRLLWDRLVKLANQRQRERAMPAPAGKMLFRVPDQIRRDGSGTMDNKTWTRGVWTGCRIASGLNGDENRPATDPRRKPVKIKDLRAFTASMLHDAGATMTEASLMLRHSDPAVTQKHYLRAATDAPHDPARPSTALRGEALTVQERIDKMWEMWLTAFPTMATKLEVLTACRLWL